MYRESLLATLALGCGGGMDAIATDDIPAVASYEVVPGWPALPAGRVLGEATGVAVDSHDHVFVFHRAGRSHKCSFSRSSDRLLEIAKGWVRLRNSDTNWRNLASFNSFVTQDEEDEGLSALVEPRSFWIDNVDWEEERVLDLIRNLNFYLLLYDYSSPTVLIHAEPDTLSINPRSRYLWDMFPAKVNDRGLDSNLMSYWAAAHDAATASDKFLQFFRIIEYVAYHHVEHETRRQIKRVLSSPHLTSQLDDSTNEVISLIREFRVQQEGERISAVVKTVVKPELIWREVCINPGYFTAPVSFEGGLQIEKLANNATDINDVPAQLLNNLARSMTKIRNALAHGKDKITGDSILPTRNNMAKLGPWVHLISAVAAEVLIYEKMV
jgi:hypothetical protein